MEVKAGLAGAPDNLVLAADAAQSYEELGQLRLKDQKAKEGALAFREAVRLRESLALARPVNTEYRERLVAALTWLAALMRSIF